MDKKKKMKQKYEGSSECKYERTSKRKKMKKVRNQTRYKYGKLKKGFEYDHITNPPKRDKFVVLSEKAHDRITKKRREKKK